MLNNFLIVKYVARQRMKAWPAAFGKDYSSTTNSAASDFEAGSKV